MFRESGSLGKCEVVHGVLAIVQRWKNLYLKESGSYIKEIIGRVPVDLIEVLSSRVDSGVVSITYSGKIV